MQTIVNTEDRLKLVIHALVAALICVCLPPAQAQIPVVSSFISDAMQARNMQLWSLVDEVDQPNRILSSPGDDERINRRGLLYELVMQAHAELPNSSSQRFEDLWTVDLNALRPVFRERCARAGLCSDQGARKVKQ